MDARAREEGKKGNPHFYWHPDLVKRSNENQHSYWHPDLVRKNNVKEQELVKDATKPLKACMVVNIYGGPGAGKSTTAAGVFYNLKRMGINCELVTEYAKDKVWEQSFKTLENQLYLLGKQSHRQFRCRDQVDLIVTDSPILLFLYYAKNLSGTFKNMVREVYNDYDNINYFAERRGKYNPAGRTQTEEEAAQVGKEIFQILKDENVDFKILETYPKDLGDFEVDKAVQTIVKDVLECLKKKELLVS